MNRLSLNLRCVVCPAGGALAEGFHERLREFQTFERTFEVLPGIFFSVVFRFSMPVFSLRCTMTFDLSGVHLSVSGEDEV